jgi:hypothetical protein
MTFDFIVLWLNYQMRLIQLVTTQAVLEFYIEHLCNELHKAILMFPGHDFTALDEEVSAAIQKARSILVILDRARVFSGEAQVTLCTHQHRRRGTGIFYNSVGLIHCLECKGWQHARSAIV